LLTAAFFLGFEREERGLPLNKPVVWSQADQPLVGNAFASKLQKVTAYKEMEKRT
jgi:hypothetical protein